MGSTASACAASFLAEVFRQNEDWLVRRILDYALERGFTRYTSTRAEAWRISIRGLTSSLALSFEKCGDADLEIGPDDTYTADPSAEYGIVEAMMHRERGIPLRAFLALMKYYKRSYTDLVRQVFPLQADLDRNLAFVERYFDRVEIAFCVAWAGTSDQTRMEELQGKNRDLVNEKNLFLTIMESFPHPAYLLDFRKTIRAVNLAGHALLAPPADYGASHYGGALLGEPFPLFPDEVGRFVVSDEGGLSFDGELPVENGFRQFQVHLCRILDISGQFSGVLAVLTDISPRIQAQRELAAKHEQLCRLIGQISFAKRELEGAMDCVREMVVFTDEEGRIRRCNRSFQNFVGREYLQIIGGRIEGLLRERNVIVDLLESQEAEVCQEDTGRWFHLRSIPFISEKDRSSLPGVGISSGNVVTIHDVTEQKRIQREVEAQNAKLTDAYNELKRTQSHILQQEKMASIGQLAAGVAHEINNPMGFIASNLRSLQKYVVRLTRFIEVQDEALRGGGGEPEAVRKARADAKIGDIQTDIQSLVEESLEGAERVRRIVQNLKSFSHVDQSELKLADINECLDSTINIVWNEIKYKATLTKDQGEIPLTRCYPQQINQVLMNMLVNASHAIEKQGEIRVRTWADDGSVFVSVADTGCGIPQANLDHIFEPFFTTKEVGKGTGLGLSIAYDIVKKHGGAILVDSEVGKGSTFTVRIPLVDPR